MRKVVYIICLCTALAVRCAGQETEFIFSYLGEQNGLSDNIVNCFLEDSHGMLWVGTYNGLNSFDGANFYNYKKRKDGNSLANEVVHSLCEDHSGRIWGATDNGVFCYQPDKDVFTNYQVSQTAAANSYFNIRCDSFGNIWTSNKTVLYQFNPQKQAFDSLYSPVSSDGSPGQIRKNGLRPDPQGEGVWMATSTGIVHYRGVQDGAISFRELPESTLFHERSTSALVRSPDREFWFCDNDASEIIAFDPVTAEITKRIPLTGILPHVWGATLFEDNSERLWFCNWDYDILVFDLAHDDQLTHISHQADNQRSVASDFFWDAYQDADGTIWIGTPAGISRCNPERNIYSKLHLPERIPALRETTIATVKEDPVDQSLWLVTSSSLLIHDVQRAGSVEMYDLMQAPAAANGRRPGNVMSLVIYEDKIILTTLNGAWVLQRGTQRLHPYTDLPAGFEKLLCTELAFSGDSVQWFSDGRQLYRRNYISNSVRHLKVGMEGDSSRSRISLLTPGREGELWFALERDHLGYVDRNNQLKKITLKQHQGEVGVITSIDPGPDGRVWVNTRGSGLYSYDPVKNAIQFLDETDGLTSSRMHTAMTDEEGRVWSMFYQKVAVLIPGANGFFHFSLPFTLDRSNYQNSITRRSNGHLLASVANDLVEFFPERLETVRAKRNPQISRVSVQNRNISEPDGKKLVFADDENTVKFRFGTLTDPEFFPYEISYFLEGAEDQWSVATRTNEVLYHNLAPGDYTFRVKVTGQNTYWNSDEATLPFTIRTPWYRTFWFLALVTMIVAGTIIMIYRYRLRQKERLMALQGKAQALEKEKAIVMYESLKQQLNPHFLFNSLTSLSGLIELDQQVAGDFLEQLSSIYRYILKNGDQELVSLQEELEFVKLFITLQKTRFKEGLQVQITVPDAYLHEKIVPVTLQNMIENAIKHNIIDAGTPLIIEITVEDSNYLVVRNTLQRKSVVETSNKKGLAQFISLYRYMSDQPVLIRESETHFEIRIPLI